MSECCRCGVSVFFRQVFFFWCFSGVFLVHFWRLCHFYGAFLAFLAFSGVHWLKTQHKEHQSCIGRSPGGCVTCSAFQVGSRPGLKACGLRAEGMRTCTSRRAGQPAEPHAHKQSRLILSERCGRPGQVSSSRLRVFPSLVFVFTPLGDPVTSHLFVLLCLICANGGQSGVPSPTPGQQGVLLFTCALRTAGWLRVTKISQEASRTIIPVAE